MLAVVAAACGWAATSLYETFASKTIPVPLTAALFLGFMAIGLVMWTILLKPKMSRRPGQEPVDPIIAARSAALAMACSRVGALVAGFYLGVAIPLASEMAYPLAAERFWISLSCVGASIVLVAAALWLETICRIPSDDDEDSGGSAVESYRDAG